MNWLLGACTILSTSIGFGVFGLDVVKYGDLCVRLERQDALLDEKASKILLRYGIVELADPGDLPAVYISKEILPDCKSRWVVSRYVTGFLYRKSEYNLTKNEIQANKKSIAKVVSVILQAPYDWLTTGYQNLERLPYEFVSDSLMPDWEPYFRDQMEKRDIKLSHFPEKMFKFPPAWLLPLIKRDLATENYVADTAYLYFLLRNLGEKVDVELAITDLRQRKGFNQLTKQEEFTRETRRLLQREKISRNEVYEFKREFFGAL